MSNFANTYPSLEGTVVMQGHVDYCRDHGHATHSVIGTNGKAESIGERCPRCGDLLTASYLKKLQREADEDLELAAALYAAWRRAVKRDEAIASVAAARAARAEAEREAREKADEADAALTRTPRPGDVVIDSRGHFGIVTEGVKKAGINKGRISVMWTHQNYEVTARPAAVAVISPDLVAAFVAGLPKA